MGHYDEFREEDSRFDVLKLKAGDYFFNSEEGWVGISKVEMVDCGKIRLWDWNDRYIETSNDDTSVWRITDVKIAPIVLDGYDLSVETPELQAVSDMVKSPSHYQLVNGLEVKDIRKAIFDKIPMGMLSYHQADCYSRAWEYLTRACFKHDSPLEDLQKAQTYLTWMIDDISNQSLVDKHLPHATINTPITGATQ